MRLKYQDMKIVLIGPVYPYRGGIAHFTTQLGKELKKKGHETTIISYKKMYPKFLYPGKSDKDQSRVTFEIQASFILNPLNPFSWITTCKLIKKSLPDLVINQWWTTFFAPMNWALGYCLSKWKIPLAYVVHNVTPHEASPFDRFLTKLALRPAKSYIAQSPSQVSSLNDLISSKNIYYSPHPIYDQFNIEKIDRPTARKHFRLNENDFVLLFFGIVRPYKGLKYLLDVVAKLTHQGLPIKLLIAGEFWENEAEYRELIKELKINQEVLIDNRYIPNEEISIYFTAADLFIAPYINGTQSGAIKIALAFNLPIMVSEIIATDPWMKSSPENCVIIDPLNTSAFSGAIEEKYQDLLKKENLGSSNEKVPLSTWDDFVSVVEKAISPDEE